MRRLTTILTVPVLSLALTLSSCAKEAEKDTSVRTGAVKSETGLAYLRVKDAKSSSFDNTPDWAPKPDPMAPVDRDMLTRWSPELGLDNEWIYFDLGKTKVLSRIIIKWEAAYAIDYEILTSQDGLAWKRLALMEDQDGETDEINFPALKAQFVKIIGLKRKNPDWGFSMWEFEIYGPKYLNPGEETANGASLGVDDKQKELDEAMTELKTVLEPLTPEEFHKGVVYTSWTDVELGAIVSDLTLVHLRRMGVEHLAIMVPTYQEEVDSREIVAHDFKGGDTPNEESIVHAIKTAHTLGIKVTLKPHVDCMDGTFRGEIMASPEWFESYKNMILRYARLAEENNVEIFSVGTELENTTFSRWEAEWRDLINSVKEVYKGYLTYSANWTEYEGVPFWDLMDFVGIDAYFPVTKKNDPTAEELTGGWNDIADTIGEWLKNKNINKGVIFTELGYVSSDGTNKTPWATLTNPEDQKEQADSLDAALNVLHKRDWFKGMYLWQCFPQERWSPLGYPVRGKLAEEVLRGW